MVTRLVSVPVRVLTGAGCSRVGDDVAARMTEVTDRAGAGTT